MERTHFTEAFQSDDVLQKQSSTDWEQAAKQYPYASLIHLMQARRKKELSKKEISKLLIYFEHPLMLSKSLDYKQLDVPKEVLAKKESPKEDSLRADESAAVPAEDAKKKTSRLAGIKPKKVAEAAVIQNVVAQKTEKTEAANKVEGVKVEELKTQEVKTEEIKVEEAADKIIAEDADVLELINELPEENPIKKEEKVIKEEAKEEVEKITEDPGDLMVMMSFTDWLHHFKAKSENEAEEKKGKDAIRSAWQKEKLAEAMDDEEDVVPDKIFEKAMKSVSFGDGLVTEPLAELYVQQGKTEKAIELYKKLSLLNPEKRTYFASRIKDLHLLK